MNSIFITYCESFNLLRYRGCLEKGSDAIGSAICYTIYTINLSLCTQTADPIYTETFLRHRLKFKGIGKRTERHNNIV